METLIKMIVLWYDVIELIVEGFDHEFDDEKDLWIVIFESNISYWRELRNFELIIWYVSDNL